MSPSSAWTKGCYLCGLARGAEPGGTRLNGAAARWSRPNISDSAREAKFPTDMSLSEGAARSLRKIQQIPGNEVCADCGAPGEALNRRNAGVFTRFGTRRGGGALIKTCLRANVHVFIIVLPTFIAEWKLTLA